MSDEPKIVPCDVHAWKTGQHGDRCVWCGMWRDVMASSIAAAHDYFRPIEDVLAEDPDRERYAVLPFVSSSESLVPPDDE